jgi:hypothetical protein
VALWPAYMTAAGVLALAGLAKLRAPEGAATALAGIGLWGRRGAARALGGGELALAGACIAAPGRTEAVILAFAYLAFAGTILRLRAARAGGSCGCFGEAETPATLWHFGLNLAAAAVALAAVASPPPGWASVADHPAELVVAALGTAVAVALARLAFTDLPAAWDAYGARPERGSAR